MADLKTRRPSPWLILFVLVALAGILAALVWRWDYGNRVAMKMYRRYVLPILETPTPIVTPGATMYAQLTERAPQPPDPTPAGATRISPVDGMALVYIPAGPFIMGTFGNDNMAWPTEKPARVVTLDAYWIDKTLVTNALYQACVDAGACTLPVINLAEGYNTHYSDPAYGNYPVTYVNWFQSMDYCAWQGGTLPTEAQWEKAARGPSGNVFPWGWRDPAPELLNFEKNIGDVVAVDSYPAGASYYGVLDMAGQVRQWIADWYSPTYYQENPPDVNPTGPASGENRVMKGGSWADGREFVRSSARLSHEPHSYGAVRGFRCVVPAE